MRILELGVHLIAGYSIVSLLLELSVIHSEFEEGKAKSWTTSMRGNASFDASTMTHIAEKSHPKLLKTEQRIEEVDQKAITEKNDVRHQSSLPEKKIRVGRGTDHLEAVSAGSRTANSTAQSNNKTMSLSNRFFPTFGTNEFAQKCAWTMRQLHSNSNCTFLVRPDPQTHEGISHWFGSQIVSGYLFSLQTGCNLYIDYGPGIDVHQVLVPHSSDDTFQPIDWTVPIGFDCNKTYPSTCFLPRPTYGGLQHLKEIQTALHTNNLSMVPDYRFAYKYSHDTFLKQGGFRDLQQSLAGLDLETAMACSLGSLFCLAPTATQYEPRLFSEILPTLHQDDALVLSLYIRTGHTDVKANKEKEGKKATESQMSAKAQATKIISCALELEQEYLADNNTHYSRIVWMVVSDSQYAKKYVKESYDSRNVNTTTTKLPRMVVTTSSHGVHTKSSRGPSTTDFAEAVIDWFLLGESDAVIASRLMSPSFGDTAALRTARPLYKVLSGNPPECTRALLFNAAPLRPKLR